MKRLSFALVFLIAGCATLTPRLRLANLPPPAASEQPAQKQSDWRDIVGVIHFHTLYSDGSGTFEEIARIANQQQLDFLVATDHNSLQAKDEGEQGWRGTTLILIGAELSTPAGHYLALGLHDFFDTTRLSTQEIIDAVNKQGGVGFIAHPFGNHPWTDWQVHNYTGIEIFNAKYDLLDDHWERLIPEAFTENRDALYFSLIRRPDLSMKQWDTLLIQNPKTRAVCGSDAHEYRLGNIRFAPYSMLFRLARTHLLIESPDITEEAIYGALKQGHAFVAVELSASAKGFRFSVSRNGKPIGIMGDVVALSQGLKLEVQSPEPAELRLFRDGKPVVQAVGKQLNHAVDTAGIYRIEAYRHDKLWVMTNPIVIEN